MVALKHKIYCILVSDKVRVKKGKLDDTTNLIECRVGWREKVTVNKPNNVSGIPYKKGHATRMAYFVDMATLTCVPLGSVDLLDDEFKTKMEVISRDKFWKFLGGRGLDLVEYLIVMGCGYGVLRWLEYFIGTTMA